MRRDTARRTVGALLALGLSSGAIACAGAPRPLVAGQDACEFCRMAISDSRFGGEIVTATGRLRTFDSIECLASYANAVGDSLSAGSIYVADYATSAMLPATDARFLRGGTLHSPMGRQLTSFAATAVPESLAVAYGGTVMTWDEVRAWVRDDASRASASGGSPLPAGGAAPPAYAHSAR